MINQESSQDCSETTSNALDLRSLTDESRTRVLFKRPYSVLLIDDDEDQRMIFEVFLKQSGLKVFTAESVQQAMQRMAHNYFDIVITDLKMREMDGFDLVRTLRSLRTFPSNSRIPVIVLTSCSSDVEYDALETGADMFCEKRLADKILLTQVRFLLETAA